jgi:hypothetical protein
MSSTACCSVGESRNHPIHGGESTQWMKYQRKNPICISAAPQKDPDMRFPSPHCWHTVQQSISSIIREVRKRLAELCTVNHTSSDPWIGHFIMRAEVEAVPGSHRRGSKDDAIAGNPKHPPASEQLAGSPSCLLPAHCHPPPALQHLYWLVLAAT